MGKSKGYKAAKEEAGWLFPTDESSFTEHEQPLRLQLLVLYRHAIERGIIKAEEALYYALSIISPIILIGIEALIEEYVKAEKLATVQGKQELAKKINSACRRCNMWLVDPETKEDCFLVALNDKWGGKFALESYRTKKRTKTTANIKTLLPMQYHVRAPQELFTDREK